VDFNEDGKPDLLSGEYDGTVHVYINVGSPSDPVLTDAGRVQVNGMNLSVNYYSDPTITDWNEDGLVDLLVGGGDGRVRLYINDGSPGLPHFSSMEFVQDSGSPLDVDLDASPNMADLDDDGLPDLIIGEGNGHVRFYRNQGIPGKPYFSGYSNLMYSGEEIAVPADPRLCVVDWNNDGGLDLVVGQYLSTPILYLNDSDKVLIADLIVNFTGPYIIGESGGEITFDVTVSNPNNQPITFDFYVCAQNAPIGFWGPVMNYQGVTLGAGRTITRSLSDWIPAGAPGGVYDCSVFIGNSVDWQFLQFGTFNFIKR
jgi:hypothetical protein